MPRTALTLLGTALLTVGHCAYGDTLQIKPYGQLLSTQFGTSQGLPGPVQSVEARDGRIIATVGGAAYLLTGDRWERSSAPEGARARPLNPAPPGGAPSSIAITRQGETWAVTPSGAWRLRQRRWEPLDLPREYKVRQPEPHIDLAIRQVAADRAGQVWMATDHGVLATDGGSWWHPITREEGMPYEDVLCLAIAPNGDVWGGTPEGAWRLRNGAWRYFWGQRWLPGNRINGIAPAADGSVWLATDRGVARIEEKRMSLAEKAAHYEAVTRSRHDRYGFVTHADLKKPGDLSAGIVPHASDNDGLWTAIYLCAEAFRYGATRDPEARAAAKKSMEAMLDLTRLSGYPGYPARAILRKGEVASGYDPEETVRVEGEKDKIWYTSPVDPNILCKGDTSSDELDGHYFAFYVYHELVADAPEKKEIARIVRSITDNLLRNDYTLVGHTGRRTRWGVFGPQHLNDDPRWVDERGLNSIELLCYLKVTEHITGDAKYRAAYENLIEKHHYLLNTLAYRKGQAWWRINHSDDELAYVTYYPLIQLEKQPERRAILLQSLAETWRGSGATAGIREENSPFYNFIFGALTGEPCRAQEAVETLRDWPWDLVDWRVQNGHRHDVAFRTARGAPRQQLDRVLPVSERPLMRWNGNPWSPAGGDGGRTEEDPGAWLIGYWMGRYHRLIEEVPGGQK